MTVSELISQWPTVKEKCIQKNALLGGSEYFMRGTEYDEWLMRCSRFLQINYPNDPDVGRFLEIISDKNNKEEQYDTLVGILKAINEIAPNKKIDDIESILEKICKNFHKFAKSLLNRHSNRSTIVIHDEYDVQDLLLSILRLFIDDVRPEDYVPSFAGSNSRTDFFLPKYGTYIETKMTRNGLSDKEIGEQLSIDIARYRNNCQKLICFIYDKDNLLTNPFGLISDLEKLSTEELSIRVFISPL